MDYFLVILGILCILVGIAGCLLPILPGPPLSWAGLLLLQFTRFADFSSGFFIIWGAITLIVTLLDYIIPLWGTKKFGGSKAGITGATVGMLLGIFFLPPVGIVIGPFIGAVIGELISGKDTGPAFKAALGSLVGFLLGTGLKLAASLMMSFYFFKALFF